MMRRKRQTGPAKTRLVSLLVLAGALTGVALAFAAGTASAAGTVNCAPYGSDTAADVQAAAAGGGTVTIKGTCHGTVDVATWVTLQAGAPGATINGDGGGTVLTVHNGAHVNVKSLTITNGNASTGGGIYEYNCGTTVTLTSSTVSSSTANAGGGVFVSACATLNDPGSTITQNTAQVGGGIYAADSTANVTNSTVSYNAALFGGGLYVDFATLNLTGATVANNTATYEGGGIYSQESEVTVTASSIASNSTTETGSGYGGGGIFMVGSDVLLQSSHVSWNQSDDFGGGIAYYGGTGGCFSQQPCRNAPAAGAVVLGSGLTLTNSTVDHNRANDDAGGIYNFARDGDSPVTLNQSTISYNNALNGDGGGISNYGACNTTASITATGSWFGGNLALNGEGGAIYQSNGDGCGIPGTALVTLFKTQVGRINSTVNPDRARYGGGIFNESGDGYSNVTLQSGGNVVSNKASVDGGGVFNCGGAALSMHPVAIVMSNTPNNVVTKALCP